MIHSHYYLAIAAICFCSCENLKEEFQYTSRDSEPIYIEADIPDSQSGTKTSINEDGKIFWKPCDQIGVYFGYNYANFTSCNVEPAQTARFMCNNFSLITGSNEGADGSLSDDVFWGVSPYLCANQNIEEFVDFNKYYDEPNPLARDKDCIKVYLPEYQRAIDNSFDPLSFISIAKSQDYSKMSFYNLGGCIRFKLTRSDIDMVVLQGHNNETLAGIFEVNTGSSDHIPVIKDSRLTSPTIRLRKIQSDLDEDEEKYYYYDYFENCYENDSPYLSTGVWYYIYLPPMTFSKGLSLSFVSHQSNKFATRRIDTPVTLERSQIGSFDNVDASLSYSDYDGSLESGMEYKMKLSSVTKLDDPEDLNCDGVIETEEQYVLNFICENNSDFQNDIERLGGICGYAHTLKLGNPNYIIKGVGCSGDGGSLFFHNRKAAMRKNFNDDTIIVYNKNTGESYEVDSDTSSFAY